MNVFSFCMLDRLQKIKHRFSRGYDFTKDVEVTELFDDFEWLIDSLEVVIKEKYLTHESQVYGNDCIGRRCEW